MEELPLLWQYAKAIALLEEGKKIAGVGSRAGVEISCCDLCFCYNVDGNFNPTVAYCMQHFDIVRELQDSHNESWTSL
jgi:hypothetical protein